jgi:hypothetical protein
VAPHHSGFNEAVADKAQLQLRLFFVLVRALHAEPVFAT